LSHELNSSAALFMSKKENAANFGGVSPELAIDNGIS
jgi:hypothetical protein